MVGNDTYHIYCMFKNHLCYAVTNDVLYYCRLIDYRSAAGGGGGDNSCHVKQPVTPAPPRHTTPLPSRLHTPP